MKGECEMKTTNINIHEFTKAYYKEYEYLYNASGYVAGYDEAVAFGDAFIAAHPDFVNEFNLYRHDVLSSDREVAAFAFALERYFG